MSGFVRNVEINEDLWKVCCQQSIVSNVGALWNLGNLDNQSNTNKETDNFGDREKVKQGKVT